MNEICVVRHRRDPGRPRRAVDGLYLCAGCLSALEGWITGLPELYELLGEMLPVAPYRAVRVSRTPGRPLPVNLAVVDHRTSIRGVMRSWADLVASERGLRYPPSVPRLAAWLARHVVWCAGHEWVADMVDEFRGLVGRGWTLVDSARRFTAARGCPVSRNGVWCDGQVTVKCDETWSVHCSRCGELDIRLFIEGGRKWVPADRVREYVHSVYGTQWASSTLRTLAARGIVKTKGEGRNTLYDLGTIDTHLRKKFRATA